MAEQLTEDEIKALKSVFVGLDANKTNTISIAELSESMHRAGYANVETEVHPGIERASDWSQERQHF